MKKYLSFLKEFVLINLILLLMYLVLLLLSNVFLEGDLAQFSGALSNRGDNANDLTQTKVVIIHILKLLFDVAIFLGFYVISYFKLKRNENIKKSFLKDIGSSEFDSKHFEKTYIATIGKKLTIYFLITVFIGVFLNMLSVPFSTLLMVSQTNLIESVLAMILGNGWVKKILVFVLSMGINFVVYFLYQKNVCVTVYKQWARERLYVDN